MNKKRVEKKYGIKGLGISHLITCDQALLFLQRNSFREIRGRSEEGEGGLIAGYSPHDSLLLQLHQKTWACIHRVGLVMTLKVNTKKIRMHSSGTRYSKMRIHRIDGNCVLLGPILIPE